MNRIVKWSGCLPLLAGFLCLGLLEAHAANYSMTVTFPGYNNRTETLTNFPALVTLSNNVGMSGFNYTNFSSPYGYDLRFADVLGSNLNYEIESWNTNGASLVWVQLPYLHGNGTETITATWGNSGNGQLAFTTNGAVWANGYVGVWHMDHTNGLGQIPDSTAGGWHGTQTGMIQTNGMAAGGYCVTSAVSTYYITTLSNTVSGASGLTLEAWGKVPSLTTYAALFRKDTICLLRASSSSPHVTEFLLGVGGNSWSGAGLMTGSTAIDGGVWHYVAGTYDSAITTKRILLDGKVDASSTSVSGAINAGSASLNPIYIAGGGSQPWASASGGGLVDEARISIVGRSTNWIWATYVNIASNTTVFNSYGPAAVAGVAAIANQDPPLNIGAYLATVQGNLASDGGVATTVYLLWSTNSNSSPLDNLTNLNVKTPGLVNCTLSNLTPMTSYYYTFMASNSVGPLYWANTTNNFRTTNAIPAITLVGSSNVVSTSVALYANLSSTGAWPTTVYCSWGLSNGSLTASNMGSAGLAPGLVSNLLTGLTPSMAYSYTFMASNQAGVAITTTNSFTTYPAGVDAVWVGGYAGNSWTNAANWSPAGEIDPGKNYLVNTLANTCTVTASGTFIGKSLTIASGGLFLIPDSVAASLSGVGTGNTNALVLSGGAVRFLGAGPPSLVVTNGINVADGTTNTLMLDTTSTSHDNILTPSSLSGAGMLRKTGAGALQIFGLYSPSFTGTVNIDAGVMELNAPSVFSNATVYVNVGGTNTLINAAISYAGFIFNGGTLNTLGGASCALKSPVINVAQRSYIVGLTALFNGIMTGSSNLVLAPGYTMLFASPDGSGYYGALEFGAGATNDLSGYSTTLGGLVSPNGQGLVRNSSATLATLTLQPPAGVTNDYSGSIGSSNIALVVTNRGVQKLSGSCVYTGLTLVANGTLLVNGPLSNAGGSVAVTAGGTLGGTGTINRAVAVANGAMLSPGDGGIGTLTVSNLMLSAGSTNIFELASTLSGDQVLINGNNALGGVLQVVARGGYVPVAGDHFLIMTNTGVLSGSFDNIAAAHVNVVSNDMAHTVIGRIGVYVNVPAGSVTLSNFVAGTVAPVMVNGAATGIGAYSATVSGNLEDEGGEATTVTLRWGISSGALNSVTNLGVWTQGAVSNTLTGLTPVTAYYYTFMASNSVGPCWPATTNVFTTTNAAPVIVLAGTSNMWNNAATLCASLISTGVWPTTVFCYWGTNSTTFGNSTNLGIVPFGLVSNDVSLNPSATYYWTYRATNAAGDVWASATNAFTTFEAGVDEVWVGGHAGNSWTNAANWNPAGEIDPNKNYLVNSLANTCTVTATGTFIGKSLTIATGGLLWIPEGGISALFSGTGTGHTNALILAGGTVRIYGSINAMSYLSVTNGINVADGTTNTLQMDENYCIAENISSLTAFSGGGVLNKRGAGLLWLNSPHSPAFTGTVNVNAGIIIPSSTCFSNATLFLNPGGTNALANIPYYFGLLVLNGGYLSQGYNQSLSGSNAVVQKSYVQLYNTSVNGVMTGSSNLVLLPGSILSIGNPFNGSGYYGALEFGAGASYDLMGHAATLGGLLSGAGGAGIVKNSGSQVATLTLQPPVGMTNDFSGMIGSSNIALMVTNCGVQKLSGSCSYTGVTTVAGGTLMVIGTLSNAVGAVGVNAGGTLGGTGLINRTVAVNAGGILSPGDAGIGTLIMSNLTLSSGSTNWVELGDGSQSTRVMVNGSLVLDGVLKVVVSDNHLPYYASFLIATNTGSLSGSFANLVDSYVKVMDMHRVATIGKLHVTVNSHAVTLDQFETLITGSVYSIR